MKEIRTIVFEPEEVQAALVDQCRRHGTSFPWQASIQSVVLDPESAVVTLIVADDHGFQSRLHFSQDDLTGALIGYCLRRKIPLPARAEKRFQMIEGGFALFMSLPGNATPTARAEPGREAA